jgi:PAS domain S-box-containing protein
VQSSAIPEPRNKSILARYVLAVGAAIAALMLRGILEPWLGLNNPYHTAWLAVVFAAWYCGLGPSIAATLISGIGVWYWFLPPAGSFAVEDPRTTISGLVGFLVFSSFIIGLGEANRRSGAKASAATAKFRAVFEQTSVFAGIMTLDGVMIDANRLCLDVCGYRAEEVLGRQFWETGWWRGSREVQDKIRAGTKLAAADTPYREVLSYLWADGTERLVEFELHPIRDQDGEIIFLHPTGVDVTDVKRVEAELRKSHDELEKRVEERTRALNASLASLESEIERRKTTEYVLRELSARSLRLQDEERRRIARDLHDSIGQTLVALRMMLDSLGKAVISVPKAGEMLSELESLSNQALQEIRVTSHLLHPPLLDEVGFSSAAQWYVEGFTKRSGVKANLELVATPRLTKDEELVFFRILQESLTNVLRHSGSPSVDIQLNSDAENAILSIRDYGRGIPFDKLLSFQEIGAGVGVGLGGMKQRVRNLGGHLNVQSDGTGTCVVASLPLAKAEPANGEPAETPDADPPDGEASAGPDDEDVKSDLPAPAA